MNILDQEEIRRCLQCESPTALQAETGIHRNKISAWRNGLNMSHYVCVMWSAYFQLKDEIKSN